MGVFFVRLFAIAGGGVEIDCPGFCTAILCNHRHIAFQHNGILLFKDGSAGAEICFHIGMRQQVSLSSFGEKYIFRKCLSLGAFVDSHWNI